jgi:DNA-nicking Smr family endonuclease
MKKEKNAGEDDSQLWRKAMESVRPYASSRKRAAVSPAAVEKKTARGVVEKREAPEKMPPVFSHPHDALPGVKGFDRSTETKLKKGQLPLEGKLDLHGMTQEKAFSALRHFVLQAAAAEKRTVLVITGKGSAQRRPDLFQPRDAAASGGVLKRMLPLWLDDAALKKHVLAMTPAQPKDGGAGAFYIRLRKRRDAKACS